MKTFSITIKARGLGEFFRHHSQAEYQLAAVSATAASKEALGRFSARGYDMEILSARAVQIG